VAVNGYIMRPIFIFITTIFFCISSNAQAGESEPYDYDTTLKGGYTISFRTDDSLQYLYLKKGNKTIVELASTSKGMIYKNLGYVAADFNYYFVLVHSFDSGNPHYVELIKKTTGKNILKEGAAWIGINEEKEILLYCDNDVPAPKDKMILFNVRTGKKQFFNFPSDIFSEPEILTRIQIDKLTDKQLVLKYDSESGSRTKVYSR
jgi:hypothetical protein